MYEKYPLWTISWTSGRFSCKKQTPKRVDENILSYNVDVSIPTSLDPSRTMP